MKIEHLMEENKTSQQNYDSWVFGLCSYHYNDLLESRYFLDEKRDRLTLLPII